MKQIFAALVGAALLTGGSTTAAAAAPPPGHVVQAKKHIPGSYIVVLKDANPTAIRTSSANLASRYGGDLRATFVATIHGFAVRAMSEQQARRLAADPAVRTVYEDGTASTAGDQPNPTWGLDRVDQRDTPLDKNYAWNGDGANTTVYIIDSGIKKDFAEFEGRAGVGADFIDDGQNGNDCFGHGNHVAGTIGSRTYGVAKKVKLVALRALGTNCGNTGPDSASVQAMEWVAANGAPNSVVNMSLRMDNAGVGDEALKAATAKGHLFVVAAGNENQDACNVSPARVPEAVTVGGTALTSQGGDARYSGSNHGTCVDISAPAQNVVSLSLSEGGTATMTGTSMATPHVAGAAAMYRTWKPGDSPQQVRDALVANATDGKIPDLPSGTPNKLLYTKFIGGGGGTCAAGSNATDVAIPDAGAAAESPATVTGCTGNASATTAVKVDINHTFTADLAIELVGPSGAVFGLKKSGGMGEATGVHTVFMVNASGETKNGTWKLRVTDVYTYDTGVIDAWTVTP
ncbi:S8 family serine peptidase [Nonomuraea sp. NPDC050556]|uniref:S8 family serine peptidase n=1 Tax=Nonomuraea sp. NPDC050556 TaxID=3364369 RepID=UPI0037881F41